MKPRHIHQDEKNPISMYSLHSIARLTILTILILGGHLQALIAEAAEPKYPLVTLEIPSIANTLEAPTSVLTGLQNTIITEFKKKNLFAAVVPTADVLDGVLVIQGTVTAWEQPTNATNDGTLTIQLTISQKIVTCPLNRAVITGPVTNAMLKTGLIEPNHLLVKGTLKFLSSVTGDK